jgi:uncharacterized protein YcbX
VKPGAILNTVDSTTSSAMHLAAIWRYPVKSLQGEQVSEAVLDSNGLRGDRCWAVRDENTGKMLTGRREPQLLLAAATLADDGGEPDIVLPSGEVCRGTGPGTDAALSDWLKRPVTLVGAVGAPSGEAEYFADATDDNSEAIAWTMPRDRFVDAAAILLLTTASLRTGGRLYPSGDWDVRRFRPNLLVNVDIDAEGWVEDAWCEHTVHIGSVELVPIQQCIRCTMVTRPQPKLDRDLDIYKTISHHHNGTLGLWSAVQAPGSVAVNDPVIVTATT